MKPTRKLIIGLTSFIFLSLSSMDCFGSEAASIPFRNSQTSSTPGRQRAPFRIPLTASYTPEDVNINFIYSVGIATITIIDEYGSVVYLEMTDTSTQSDLYIPIDTLYSGNYFITIQYGSITLNGYFSIE